MVPFTFTSFTIMLVLSQCGCLASLVQVLNSERRNDSPGSDDAGFPYLHRRLPQHPKDFYIIANCIGNNGLKTPQVAYFEGATESPQCVASPVDSPSEDPKVWAAATTTVSLLCNENARTVTADLSAAVPEGYFAGTFTDGTEKFTCWRKLATKLYSVDGMTCDGLYKCKDGKPLALMQTPESSTLRSPTSSPTSTPTGNSDKEPDTEAADPEQKHSGKSSGLSKSDKIALGVGIGFGIPSLIATVWGVLYARKQSRRGARNAGNGVGVQLQPVPHAGGTVPAPTGGNTNYTSTSNPPANQTNGDGNINGSHNTVGKIVTKTFHFFGRN